jgi:hypothetical protein
VAVVIGAYRARASREAEVELLLRRHIPTLRSLGLATDRLGVLLRCLEEPVFLELFEWAAPDAVTRAHEETAVKEIWDALELAAEFISLSALPQSDRLFPHFQPLSLDLRE